MFFLANIGCRPKFLEYPLNRENREKRENWENRENKENNGYRENWETEKRKKAKKLRKLRKQRTHWKLWKQQGILAFLANMECCPKFLEYALTEKRVNRKGNTEWKRNWIGGQGGGGGGNSLTFRTFFSTKYTLFHNVSIISPHRENRKNREN